MWRSEHQKNQQIALKLLQSPRHHKISTWAQAVDLAGLLLMSLPSNADHPQASPNSVHTPFSLKEPFILFLRFNILVPSIPALDLSEMIANIMVQTTTATIIPAMEAQQK